MKMRKILWATVGVAIVVAVVGLTMENWLTDFTKNLLAGIFSILVAFVLAWLFFEKPTSKWLKRIGVLLEREEQHQRFVQQSWAETVLLPTALILLEVTHQLVHDLQDIEDDISVPDQEGISQQAKKVLVEVHDLFRETQDKQIEINAAAARSLTQSGRLLDRLEAYLQSGPDWIREDVKIANRLQEALRKATDNFPPNLILYSNIHPMARRVKLLPKDFETVVGIVNCTNVQLYLEELANLVIALDSKVHGEGFD